MPLAVRLLGLRAREIGGDHLARVLRDQLVEGLDDRLLGRDVGALGAPARHAPADRLVAHRRAASPARPGARQPRSARAPRARSARARATRRRHARAPRPAATRARCARERPGRSCQRPRAETLPPIGDRSTDTGPYDVADLGDRGENGMVAGQGGGRRRGASDRAVLRPRVRAGRHPADAPPARSSDAARSPARRSSCCWPSGPRGTSRAGRPTTSSRARPQCGWRCSG